MVVTMPDIQIGLLLPEILIASLAMALLLYGAWNGKGARSTVGVVSLLGILAAALLTYQGAPKEPVTTFGGMFVNDAFAVYMKIFMYAATAMALMLSQDYLRRLDLDRPEYYVLSLFALLGGMVMASSGDFVTLYLGLELMSLSIYVLAAFRRDDVASNEAGLKYFILGSVASGLLLYGISLIYGAAGTTSLKGIHAYLMGDYHHATLVVNLAVVMVVAGMGFKIAAAPFHMWAPDVYEGAPTSVTAFMAAMPKLGAFALIYRVLLEAFAPLHAQWGPILQLLAVLSLAVGALAAIPQTNIKRMLAYSSIGHMGYALIGLAAGNTLGVQGVLVYLAIYIFMNLGAFAMILVLNRDGIGEQIDDYKGLAHKRPLLAFIMALFMFSMAGIPPLAGFIGKLYVFLAAVQAGMLALAVVGVLFSAIGAFYYLRIVKLMYFDAPEAEFTMTIGHSSRLVIAVSTVAVVVWGIFPGGLLAWAQMSIKMFH